MPPSPLCLAPKCQCLDVRRINTLFFFSSPPSSFSSVTHFQHMAALHYEKGNSRTSAADGKDTTNPKHLLYSSPQPHIQVHCFHVSHPTGASSPLGFTGQRHFVRDVIGRHEDKDQLWVNRLLETYSEIHTYIFIKTSQ